MNKAIADQIINEVCTHFKLQSDELLQPGKGLYNIQVPRILAMYLLYKNAKCTYKQAGTLLNRKSSVSAFNACIKIEKKIRLKDSVVIRFLEKYGYWRNLSEGRRVA